MNKDNKKYKNLVFDFSGVFFNLEYKAMFEHFHSNGVQDLEKHVNKYHYSPFFIDFDLGRIPRERFCNEFRREFNTVISDEIIFNGVLSLLKDFNEPLITWLKNNSHSYNLYLLSNNNPVAYPYLMEKFETTFGYEFNHLFKDTFYSHFLGEMKPHPEIFNILIKKTGINPTETLFIDDTEVNLKTALQLGFQVFHYDQNNKDKFWSLNL
ncbi:MAG: HAD family phosphatase [Sediminibacterium sp.]|nr:HAD family phosphatase [Sediminibacterium sp.]